MISGAARARLHCILVQPAIAGNAGTTARSCVAFPATLHLVNPAFDVFASRRASVGYVREQASEDKRAIGSTKIVVYDHIDDFVARGIASLDRLYAFSKESLHGTMSLYDWDLASDTSAITKARADRLKQASNGDNAPDSDSPSDQRAVVNIGLMFGNESYGLNRAMPAIQPFISGCLFIPMQPPARSLNLGVCTGIALCEATRQLARAGIPVIQ